MTTKLFTLTFIIIFGFSCSLKKHPWKDSTYHGIFEGCDLDSSSFMNEKVLRISSSMKRINTDCSNKPSFCVEQGAPWPMDIFLKFRDNSFLYGYNPRVTKGGIGYNVDGGKLNYNKKTQSLTLISDKFGWTKVFKLQYSEIDSVLILTEIKNGY
jgi:hypothetical protein